MIEPPKEDLGYGLLSFFTTLLTQNIHPTYAPCQLSQIFLGRASPLSYLPWVLSAGKLQHRLSIQFSLKSEEGIIFVSIDSLLAPHKAYKDGKLKGLVSYSGRTKGKTRQRERKPAERSSADPSLRKFLSSWSHIGCAHFFWHHIATAHMKSCVIEKPQEKQSLGAYAGGHHISSCSLHCNIRLPRGRECSTELSCLRKQTRENKPVF